VVRERATDDDWEVRQKVAELLAFDDEPTSLEILLERVRKDDDWDVLHAAAASARRRTGPESLELDYALVQAEYDEVEDDTLTRLRERGDPLRILQALPGIREEYEDELFRPLVAALTSRDPLPLEAAAEALASPDARTVEVAAGILGRGGDAASAHDEGLVTATRAAIDRWKADLQRLLATERLHELDGSTARLGRLLWACGRLGVGAELLIEASTLGGIGAEGLPLRTEAITALTGGAGGAAGAEALAAAATSPEAPLRALASSGLARLAPRQAAALAEQALDDRSSFDRLVATLGADRLGELLRGNADNPHLQGVLLPHLVAQADLHGLAALAADGALEDDARLGAIEALAKMASEPAEDAIRATATDEATDEELRKAAWRALRRSKRARAGRKGANR